MSFRTILVGILAAICGVSATVGVNLLNKGKSNKQAASTVVVARMKIGNGAEITADMVEQRDWPANLMPPGSFKNVDEVIGKFAFDGMVKDEPVLEAKINDEPTNLVIPDGYRGVAILTPDEATSVGRLVVPGNRVDIILTVTKTNNVLDLPETWTLVENVEVLATGQRWGGEKTSVATMDPTKSDSMKSVTLLLTPEMAKEVNLGAEFGKLHLILRSPTDDSEEIPRERESFVSLVAKAKIASKKKVTDPEVDKLNQQINKVGDLLAKFQADVAKQLAEKSKTDNVVKQLTIPDGMRAVTIQTPNESTGVAGLLQPNDHVDVLLTLQTRVASLLDRDTQAVQMETHTILENIIVLAVDTKVLKEEGSSEPKMSKSVTLLVTPDMARHISLGSKVGTLALTLRGKDDKSLDGPKVSADVGELINPTPPAPVETEVADNEKERSSEESSLLILRGGQSKLVPFIRPIKNPSRDDVSTK